MGVAAAGRYEGSGWGHHGARALIASIVGSVLLAVRPLPAENPASVLLPVALFAFVVVSWLAMRRHDRGLCERCLHTMPLDAAATAQRHHRRFAAVHAAEDRRLVVAYLVVLLGSNGLLLLEGVVPRLAWAVVQLSMIYPVLAYTTHRTLQPWCPWCSGGGGGEDVVDAPGPLPVGGDRVG